MNIRKRGEFYGRHYRKSTFDNTIITDTEYTHPKVDWHYHENPYFTYLLEGHLFECNKKESYYLKSGDLLFHNWQDAHYNVTSPIFTRGFHIELNREWFLNFDIPLMGFEGSSKLRHPSLKKLMNQIFIETKIDDQYSSLSIESCLIDIFNTIKGGNKKKQNPPSWIKKLEELLLEENIDYSLNYLAGILDIHPVHLSREFSKYFGISLGHYVRLIKINKAFNLLISNAFSMTEICYMCGFYDQSHFISNFKRVYHTSPKKILKKIL